MDFKIASENWSSLEQTSKFASHMAEETVEAPAAVRRALDGSRDALRSFARLVRSRNPAFFLTCARGSSDHAAGYFKYLSEIVLGLPCCSIGPSVVSIYGSHLTLRDTILITVSQSGRSPDILSCQAEAKRARIPTIAVTNDETSPLARDADLCLPLQAGPELSVAATKTFICSAALLAAMIAGCAGDRRLEEAVERLPDALEQALGCRWDAVENALARAQSLYVLGRGPSLAMAREAALKLKEICRLHAEAYSAAEVMHGPMALVRAGFPVLVLAPSDAAQATTAESAAALAEAHAQVLTPAHHPTLHPLLDPISIIQTFYVSAERLSRRLGLDPDAPKLLSKVTRTR
jgi:glucosamine--fructose-6-phosphate aminotransferase (isomerizing)